MNLETRLYDERKLGLEQGVKIGIDQGLTQGREEGHAEGLTQGRNERPFKLPWPFSKARDRRQPKWSLTLARCFTCPGKRRRTITIN